MELSERLDNISEKLQQLQQKLQAVELDKAKLEAENNRLKDELHSFQNEKSVANINILEHAQKKEKEEEGGERAVLNQDIHQQIDHYLSEIDHCIEWLRQQ